MILSGNHHTHAADNSLFVVQRRYLDPRLGREGAERCHIVGAGGDDDLLGRDREALGQGSELRGERRSQERGTGAQGHAGAVDAAGVRSVLESAKAAQAALNQQKALEPLITEYISINYSDAKTEILPHVKPILTPSRGQVSVDTRNNQLIVTDTVDKIEFDIFPV